MLFKVEHRDFHGNVQYLALGIWGTFLTHIWKFFWKISTTSRRIFTKSRFCVESSRFSLYLLFIQSKQYILKLFCSEFEKNSLFILHLFCHRCAFLFFSIIIFVCLFYSTQLNSCRDCIDLYNINWLKYAINVSKHLVNLISAACWWAKTSKKIKLKASFDQSFLRVCTRFSLLSKRSTNWSQSIYFSPSNVQRSVFF